MNKKFQFSILLVVVGVCVFCFCRSKIENGPVWSGDKKFAVQLLFDDIAVTRMNIGARNDPGYRLEAVKWKGSPWFTFQTGYETTKEFLKNLKTMAFDRERKIVYGTYIKYTPDQNNIFPIKEDVVYFIFYDKETFIFKSKHEFNRFALEHSIVVKPTQTPEHLFTK